MNGHQSHEDIIKRIKRAQGHLTKVLTMIEEGEGCLKTAQQFHAVVRALGNAKRVFIQDHIDHCITDNDMKNQEKTIKELKEIVKYL